MKKLLVTTVAAAAIAAGFGGQAFAAEKTHQPVYAKVQAYELKNIDKESINQLLEKFSHTTLKEVLVDWQKQSKKHAGPAPVKQPAPEQAPAPEAAPEKQPAPTQEEKPAPQPAPAEQAPTPAEQAPAPSQQQPAPEKPQAPEQEQVNGISQEEQQMLDLVNQERSQRGLAPLKADLELTKVARVKAQDMIDNNYFSHQSPTYGSPFDMMSQFGIQYRTAGENLAGNQTVEAAHQALMNSQGHRENILKGDYTEVGIGVVDGGPYGKMFVQLFKG